MCAVGSRSSRRAQNSGALMATLRLIELENAAEQKAVDRGILDRANENAQRIIRGAVGSLVDLSEYRLSFRTLPEKEES